jgi:hypothetical protein
MITLINLKFEVLSDLIFSVLFALAHATLWSFTPNFGFGCSY